jgi:hypothetical protein
MGAPSARPSATAWAILIFLAVGSAAPAQETIRLRESFVPGYQYKVSSRVEISGSLTLPTDKDHPAPRTLRVQGTSAVEYFERVLALARDAQVEKTVRYYQRIDFERKVGEETQQSILRPEVRRLVMLRNNHKEVPFCPNAPMTWGEIDLIRTDVFTPALTGLLAAQAVRLGEGWQATTEAVLELTDLEKLEEGKISCKLESFTVFANRKHARVAFQGSVRGLGEDGPTRHEVDGHLLFDLESNHLSYLSMKGSQYLLDPTGKTVGKVEGTFVLTRQPLATCKELADDSLRGLALDPTEENTLLLYDNPDLGIRFLYPRRWRVAGVSGRQIGLDEARGSGLLITLESLPRLPTGGQFLNEARLWLGQQKATIVRAENPRAIAGTSLEQFGFEADIARQRVWLDYYVTRQQAGGATVAARLLPADLNRLRDDVGRIARSIQISRKQ